MNEVTYTYLLNHTTLRYKDAVLIKTFAICNAKAFNANVSKLVSFLCLLDRHINRSNCGQQRQICFYISCTWGAVFWAKLSDHYAGGL